MFRSISSLHVLLALWVIAYAASFVFYLVTAPSDFGFTRGLNRVMGFLGWQVLAGFVSVFIWVKGRRLTPGSVIRRITWLPLILFVVPFLALIAALTWAVATSG